MSHYLLMLTIQKQTVSCCRQTHCFIFFIKCENNHDISNTRTAVPNPIKLEMNTCDHTQISQTQRNFCSGRTKDLNARLTMECTNSIVGSKLQPNMKETKQSIGFKQNATNSNCSKSTNHLTTKTPTTWIRMITIVLQIQRCWVWFLTTNIPVCTAIHTPIGTNPTVNWLFATRTFLGGLSDIQTLTLAMLS